MTLVYKDHLSCCLRKLREICKNLNFVKINILELLIYLECFVLKSILYSKILKVTFHFLLKNKISKVQVIKPLYLYGFCKFCLRENIILNSTLNRSKTVEGNAKAPIFTQTDN